MARDSRRLAVLGLGLALAACSEQRAASQPPGPERVAAMLVGDWRHAYVTAGTIASYGRLLFGGSGALLVDSYRWAGASRTCTCTMGTYAVTPERTVRFGWEDGSSRILREHAAALVEAGSFEGGESPRGDGPAQRYWAVRGYVAQDASLARFAGGTAARAWKEGVLVGHQSSKVTLAFSSPPSSVPPDAGCTLELEIAAEAQVGAEVVARSASFSLPCAVRKRNERLLEIVIAGWRAPDAARLDMVPLPEAPAHHTPSAWWEYLRAEGYDERWPEESLLAELRAAFSPALLFDRDRPDVLFPRYLDTNAAAPSVYAQVAPGSAPAWWSGCADGQACSGGR